MLPQLGDFIQQFDAVIFQ
ncbi:hypothetical protein ANOM_011866 [Aspergillus nomiae NRRL 13137]|uniref:Uncharacterized protein n=1 Tax=Aspergillus nomiae NRRL (strain ATCC 15546 / NRRL 13137 / CBS 260.88 / M93) TaxID=1509407 RepID=A0A0L1IJP3_ASPN3|nr:hypothetical protein ANOM_011866 [Aspergillus nomiae NRRL 13137]